MPIVYVIIIAALSGATLGGGGVLLLTRDRGPDAAAAVEATASVVDATAAVVEASDAVEHAQVEVQADLVAPDRLTVACASEWMTAHGTVLCRELFCRQTTVDAADAATAQGECEQISNIANTELMLGVCAEKAEGLGLTVSACLDTFYRRK